ncbi:PhzF family phenazine biosynthesis protein [Rhodovulum sp. MB263]|uniref:PhzF family phenazine biosynthesis protein n=1 Tax=Rhodovulum sp. (strain MB263) TaxID=308754 RepID=UPI003519A66B
MPSPTRSCPENPAAVLLLPDWLDEALMRVIARENNLAETAFAVGRAEGGWELRWFTPTQGGRFLRPCHACGRACADRP